LYKNIWYIQKVSLRLRPKSKNMASKNVGRFEVYRSGKEFRWRFVRKGRKIFASTESYKRKVGAKKSILAAQNCSTAEIFDITGKR